MTPEDVSVERTPVKVWTELLNIPTYEPMLPDKNPMFLDRRVYQGSSGKVYPLPFIDRISSEKTDHEYKAVWLENEFVRVMALPELGGRIHVIQDKINGYDCIYRQDVIKPALVGLAGPWVSGGIEFNWPQHHRPATYMPTEYTVDYGNSGNATVWFSDIDPISRMQGMHGISLYACYSYVELKVRLNNRTPFTQTFLWWANMGVRVNDDYQSIFPPDVHSVADHAKRAVSDFPICSGKYYGVDYSPGTRLDWFKNIPVPTSYMAIGSKYDFVGGYDHGQNAGILHIADHYVSPGKKQWTWGNSEFGSRWYKHLTDDGGKYIEIMAGVFTENQPDFSFLAPGEVKEFKQYWYPIRDIGIPVNANKFCAVGMARRGSNVDIAVSVTVSYGALYISLWDGDRVIGREEISVSPDKTCCLTFELPSDKLDCDLSVAVDTEDGPLIGYVLAKGEADVKTLAPATEPDAPENITTIEELYLTGLHLWQYRHATRDPLAYWNEALKRDPGDYRCNNAVGLWRLRRGEFVEAADRFRAAISRLCKRNPNPPDVEPFYNLGLALRYQGDIDGAYNAFYKATWNAAWAESAGFELASIDFIRRDWNAARRHLKERVGASNRRRRNLKLTLCDRPFVLRNGSPNSDIWDDALRNDPLDLWTRYMTGTPLTGSSSSRLELALELKYVGYYDDAIQVITDALSAPDPGTSPMLHYHRASLYSLSGKSDDINRELVLAQSSAPDYCFPSRLEDYIVLEWAITIEPKDGRAKYYLGNLLYNWGRREDAISLWEESVINEPGFSIPWRNLGIGYANVRKELARALYAYDRALLANPGDSRLVYERDQLWKKSGTSPSDRLRELEVHLSAVNNRDDLSLELTSLYNLLGQPDKALASLQARSFQPWEGGEGQTLKQFIQTYINLGKKALADSDANRALDLFREALMPPDSIGEAAHPLANFSDIYFWLGEAANLAGDAAAAHDYWQIAADFEGDFQEMAVTSFSEQTYYEALSLRRLGREIEADELLKRMLNYANEIEHTPAMIDYFATSLPTMLIFEDDIEARNIVQARLLNAYANAGLGNFAEARAVLQSVIDVDPNNALAVDLISGLE